jgi:hypothetical protein
MQGAAYVSVIERDSPHLLTESLAACRSNDSLGSPLLFEYPGVGRVSPVTLRYLKVLSDLERHFGDLTGMHVVEIGVGYGGQCQLITSRWKVASYTLVDLEGPLALTRRYLSKLAPSAPLIFVRGDDVTRSEYDLCISNYAFSELSRSVQDRYAEAVVRTSARGHVTCNFVSSHFDIDSWTKSELSDLNVESRWIAEEPQTHPANAVLVWGGRDVQALEAR